MNAIHHIFIIKFPTTDTDQDGISTVITYQLSIHLILTCNIMTF